MSTYFLLDPFEFPYYFYRIRGELIYVLSIAVCIPSISKHYILETCNQNLIELIFKPLLILSLATGTDYRITFKSKRHNLQRQRRPYTVVIC